MDALADTPWPMFRHDIRHTGRSPYTGPEAPAALWSFPTGDIIYGSPAIGADGTIYVTSKGGGRRLFAINPDGSEKWSFLLGGLPNQGGSSPAIAADGTIYVGSHDGKLYAIGSNRQPDQSTNASPSDGADNISLTPVLQSSAFSDPDSGDNHTASQWQVTTSPGDYSSPVFDSGTDTSNLTSITIPSGTLDYSTTYYWRVSHQDNHGTWSEWSAETNFTTAGYPLADTPWPMFHHDLRHTGRSPYTGPANPVLQWSYATGSCIEYSSPAIGDDGT
ncbi:MAG: PQQ-like beta-propeller repeat protein, partial [Chloroflexi bacterium]|nr:PQQ-like beta-propeller repeat protein [Chloroflexota bacterium]